MKGLWIEAGRGEVSVGGRAQHGGEGDGSSPCPHACLGLAESQSEPSAGREAKEGDSIL